MTITPTMTTEELTNVIICDCDDDLYQQFDEDRLLGLDYEAEELYEAIVAWITEGNEAQ